MNCEEFWEKASEYLTKGEKICSDLQKHISYCQECKDNFETLQQAFNELKAEIKHEMPPVFWNEMRENIVKNIKIPNKIWDLKRIERLILVPSLVMAAVFVVFSFFKDFNMDFTKKSDFESHLYYSDTPLMILSGLTSEEVMLLQKDGSMLNEDEPDFDDSNLNSNILGGVTDDLSMILLDK